jgi:hypothetical protein
MPSSAEHDPGSVNQNVTTSGNQSNTNVAGRDIIIVNLPLPDRTQRKPSGRKSNAHNRIRPRASWSRIGGAVTLLSTAVAAALLQFATPDRALTRPVVWPEGKSALCNDGWYSASRHHSGTCSSHGGVAFWRDGTPAPDGRSSEALASVQ